MFSSLMSSTLVRPLGSTDAIEETVVVVEANGCSTASGEAEKAPELRNADFRNALLPYLHRKSEPVHARHRELHRTPTMWPPNAARPTPIRLQAAGAGSAKASTKRRIVTDESDSDETGPGLPTSVVAGLAGGGTGLMLRKEKAQVTYARDLN